VHIYYILVHVDVLQMLFRNTFLSCFRLTVAFFLTAQKSEFQGWAWWWVGLTNPFVLVHVQYTWYTDG
jgi:hypothetical protein